MGMGENSNEIVGLLLLRAAEVAYADVLVKLSHRAKMEDINSFISEVVASPLLEYMSRIYRGECDLLLRFFESNLESLKYHVDKFLRDNSIVEGYRVYPAVGRPKAWYHPFKLKF
ncbi:MAG: hypothetical protein DRP38_08530 [Thermotogae bacterium]|nr:MAG: hypothetical protein DRP38_08530 [Thermotogota bacterium]